jgi:hypothetical protein
MQHSRNARGANVAMRAAEIHAAARIARAELMQVRLRVAAASFNAAGQMRGRQSIFTEVGAMPIILRKVRVR